MGPAEDHGKGRTRGRVGRVRAVGDKSSRMSGSTGRRPGDGTTSRSQKEKGDIVYVISVLVHEIEDMLFKL